MIKTLHIEFEKNGHFCQAVVTYTPPQGKWVADSDLDYYGGYSVEDMVFYNSDGESVSREEAGISYQDIFREFDIADESCYGYDEENF